MIDDDVLRDPVELLTQCIHGNVTRMMMTPSLLSAVLAIAPAVDAWKSLRCRLSKIVLCGEVASSSLLETAQRLLPHVAVYNLYSLSECHDVAMLPSLASSGCVFPGVEVSVIHDDNDDEFGRVCISGRGLAVGHVVGSELRQVGCGFAISEGKRSFISSDCGRLLPDGALQIKGRSEDSALVKIRGFFVSTDQVEQMVIAVAGGDIAQVAVLEIEGKK